MSEEMCPFVGIESDRLTAVGFPSPRNFCHHAANPQAMDVVHQSKFCMTAEHVSCPIYQKQPAAVLPVIEKVAAPPSGAGKQTKRTVTAKKEKVLPLQQPTKRRAREILLPLMAVAGIVAIFLSVLLILPSLGEFQNSLISSTNGAPVVTRTSTPNPIGILSGDNKTVSPMPQSSPSAPPTSTKALASTAAKKTVTSTLTSIVTATRALALPVATQCGRPAGWVQYSVRAGDSLSGLSRVFNISISQLQIANCMGNSTFLYVGQLIFTPWIPAPQIPATVIPSLTNTPVPSMTATTDTPIPTVETVEPTVVVTTEAAPTELPPVETPEANVGASPVPTEPLPTQEGG